MSKPREQIKPFQARNKIGPYILGKKLGQGTFGTVRLGTHIKTNEKVAIKILEKSRIIESADKKRVEREIKILKSLRHPNIVQLYSVIQTVTSIYLIMEYAEGKELFDYIVKNRKLDEMEACRLFHQIISTLEYIHKLSITHRDLKPENLLLDANNNIKLVDFGLSNIYKDENHLLSTACGSPCYASPEMLTKEKYDGVLSDIWSSGVVLYAMICGFLPFEDEDNDKLYQKIIDGNYEIPFHLSTKVVKLIKGILEVHPEKRYDFTKIKNSEWFNMIKTGNNLINEGLLICKYVIPVDDDIISEMNERFGYDKNEVKRNLLVNHHNYITACYYLIMKERGRKGIPSISDLQSKEFQEYIKNKINLFRNYDYNFETVVKERCCDFRGSGYSATSRAAVVNSERIHAPTLTDIVNTKSFERFSLKKANEVPSHTVANSSCFNSTNQNAKKTLNPIKIMKFSYKKLIPGAAKRNTTTNNQKTRKVKRPSLRLEIGQTNYGEIYNTRKKNFLNTSVVNEDNKNKTFEGSHKREESINKNKRNFSKKDFEIVLEEYHTKGEGGYKNYMIEKAKNKKLLRNSMNKKRKAASISPPKSKKTTISTETSSQNETIATNRTKRNSCDKNYVKISKYCTRPFFVSSTIDEITITTFDTKVSIYSSKQQWKLKKDLIAYLTKLGILYIMNKNNSDIIFCKKKDTEFVVNVITEQLTKKSILKFKKINGSLIAYRDTVKNILQNVL